MNRLNYFQGTYTIPRCQVESKPETGSRKPNSHSGEEVTGPDDDEESMDWWTKYFASVDNMIEVRANFISLALPIVPKHCSGDLKCSLNDLGVIKFNDIIE